MVDFVYLDLSGVQIRLRRSLGAAVTSKRAAEAEEDRLRAEIINKQREAQALGGRPGEPPPAAFSGFAEKWYRLHVLGNLKPSVQARYETIIRVHLVPFFGNQLLTQITALVIEEFKAENRKATVEKTGRPISAKTCNEHLGVLSSMLETAVEWGYLAANPCRRVRRLKLAPREDNFYDAQQTEVFLAKAKEIEPNYHPLFLVGFKTGMRLGEILGLRWGDLDFVNNRIHLRQSYHRGHTGTPKSGKPRLLPMTPSVVAALKGIKHLKGELVFCRPDGQHLNRDILKHPWGRIMFAAGLPTIRIHDMRHSFASQLVMAGVPLKAVSELLGHSETRITDRYAHLAPDMLHASVDVLDGVADKPKVTPLRVVPNP